MLRRNVFFFLGFTVYKIGKKSKLNFNEFILFYWKMKKKKNFMVFQ